MERSLKLTCKKDEQTYAAGVVCVNKKSEQSHQDKKEFKQGEMK